MMHAQHRACGLPALAFGARHAETGESAEAFCRQVGQTGAGDWQWVPGQRPQRFHYHSSLLKLGPLHIMAAAHSAGSFRCNALPRPVLKLPLAGVMTFTGGGGRWVARAGSTAVLLAGADLRFECHEACAAVCVPLEPEALAATASVMAGRPVQAAELALDRTRELPLTQSGCACDTLLRHVFGFFDSLDDTDEWGCGLGMDEMFRRLAVRLLRVAGPGADQSAPRGMVRKRRALELAEAFLLQRLQRPARLAEVAAAAGLSARALQYVFRARHGCGPLQWQRDRRLEEARRQLCGGAETVKHVALGLGFVNLGGFASAYRQRFGESPSSSLQGAGGRLNAG